MQENELTEDPWDEEAKESEGGRKKMLISSRKIEGGYDDKRRILEGKSLPLSNISYGGVLIGFAKFCK